MSYALIRGLGAEVSASASASTAAPTNNVSAECKTAADAFVKAATYVGLTSDSVKKVVTTCCEEFKRSGGSASSRAKGLAECFARASATAGASAACIAGGITAPFAGVCGTVGAFVADRVMGYNKTQLAAGVLASIVCSAATAGSTSTSCFYIGAELVGWIEDSIGPIIEGIFNPGAAKKRELAARAAFQSLTAARADLLLRADAAIREMWSNSIKSIKDMYQGTVGSLPASYQTKAQQILGFAPNYAGVASALVAAGVPATPMGWPIDGKGSKVGDRLRAQRAVNGGHGCESTAEGCLNDGYSEVCPFSFSDLYMTLFYSQGMDKLTGDTRDRQVAFEKQSLAAMQALANGMLPAMQQAMATVAANVAITVVGLKQQALIEETKTKDTAKFVATAVQAAKAAEAAAAGAKSWDSATRQKSIATAQNKYEIVRQVRAMLTIMAAPGSAPLSATYQKKLADAADRSAAAVKTARSNALTAELMIGGAAVAGVVGIGYLVFGRK